MCEEDALGYGVGDIEEEDGRGDDAGEGGGGGEVEEAVEEAEEQSGYCGAHGEVEGWVDLREECGKGDPVLFNVIRRVERKGRGHTSRAKAHAMRPDVTHWEGRAAFLLVLVLLIIGEDLQA